MGQIAAENCVMIMAHNPSRCMCDYAQNLVLMRYAHKNAAAAHTAVTYSESTSMAKGADAYRVYMDRLIAPVLRLDCRKTNG